MTAPVGLTRLPTVLPTMLASIVFVVVLLAMTPVPAPLIDRAPAPPADIAAEIPIASMVVSAKASTVTKPAVFTVELSMVASKALPMLFSATVSATPTLTEPAPAPPAATVADVRTARMSDQSSASTVTAPAPVEVIVLPVMLASIELVVVLLATTPARATLTDTPPAPPVDNPTAWPNELIVLST